MRAPGLRGGATDSESGELAVEVHQPTEPPSATVAVRPSPRTLSGRAFGMTTLAGFAEVPESHAAGGTAVLVGSLRWAGAWWVCARHDSSLLPAAIVPIPVAGSIRATGAIPTSVRRS